MFWNWKEVAGTVGDAGMPGMPGMPGAVGQSVAPWAPARRVPRECDLGLTGTTRAWLRRLPSGRRPLRLCATHPRVANRIAWCWSDPDLRDQVLEDLLTDRRGGRRGFPQPVVRELQRLRELTRVREALGL